MSIKSDEQARMAKRFWHKARYYKGICRRCEQPINPGQDWYMTHTNSITSHPVHLECDEVVRGTP